jgi:hypothetical protein
MRCQTEECENEARDKKSGGGKYCSKCVKRKNREKYPLKYWYDTLKMNAKRRRKDFTLTLNEFEAFCKKTGYSELKGKTATSLSVDRRNDKLGYSADNIQAITLRDNTLKKMDDAMKPDDNCPFDD